MATSLEENLFKLVVHLLKNDLVSHPKKELIQRILEYKLTLFLRKT